MRSPFPSARPLVCLPLALAVLALAPACSRPGESFPVAAYYESPDNLQGNRYTLDAEIDAQLEWKEGTGRLVAVKPIHTTENGRLPVFIADSLNANLMVAQRYRLEITVRRGGLLDVTALRKL